MRLWIMLIISALLATVALCQTATTPPKAYRLTINDKTGATAAYSGVLTVKHTVNAVAEDKQYTLTRMVKTQTVTDGQAKLTIDDQYSLYTGPTPGTAPAAGTPPPSFLMYGSNDPFENLPPALRGIYGGSSSTPTVNNGPASLATLGSESMLLTRQADGTSERIYDLSKLSSSTYGQANYTYIDPFGLMLLAKAEDLTVNDTWTNSGKTKVFEDRLGRIVPIDATYTVSYKLAEVKPIQNNDFIAINFTINIKANSRIPYGQINKELFGNTAAKMNNVVEDYSFTCINEGVVVLNQTSGVLYSCTFKRTDKRTSNYSSTDGTVIKAPSNFNDEYIVSGTITRTL